MVALSVLVCLLGILILLFGIITMSSGLKKITGEKSKKILKIASFNRFISFLTGIGITSFLQSSSLVSVTLVSFISSGIISLESVISILLGANVGATITAHFIAAKIPKEIFIILILGGTFTYIFSKTSLKYLGKTILGFGSMFFGMSLLKSGLIIIKGDYFLHLFPIFKADTILGIILLILMGTVLTIAVQSSTVTIGTTVVLASSGFLDLPSSLALVLGSNIGTTVTAEIAALVLPNVNAKRAARAHTLFNIFGVVIVLCIFPYYINTVSYVSTLFPSNETGKVVAMGHTMFNIINGIFFLIVLKPLVSFVTVVIPNKIPNL